MSTYTGTTSKDGIDPCTKLDSNQYGKGWRTPSKNEFDKLNRCTDQVMVSNNGVMGIWFMNKTIGLFLPAAGYRTTYVGSGTTANDGAGTSGSYWSSDPEGKASGYGLNFYNGYTDVSYYNRSRGFSVRCVKGTKQ